MTVQESAYNCQWVGSTDPDDLSGVALFKVVGMNDAHAVRLCSAQDFQVVRDWLDAATYEGERRATQNLRAKIMQALGPDPYA